MPKRRPLTDTEINLLGSAIGAIEPVRLRTDLAPKIWTSLTSWDKSLATEIHKKRWNDLTRTKEPFS